MKENLKGEVNFRKKVVAQDMGEDQIEGWRSAEEMEDIIKDRVERLTHYYQDYVKFGLDPALELAAGRCQLSMVLKEKFNIKKVVATDISLDTLQSAKLFKTKLNFSKSLPDRIQCNIENLPFNDCTFKHVAIWAALHHFENPKKAVSEVERVLCHQGTFFVGGEPIKPILKVPLLRLMEGAYESPSIMLRVLWKLRISAFFTKFVTKEEEFGVIENSFRPQEYDRYFKNFERLFWFIIPNMESDFLKTIFSKEFRTNIYGGSLENALLRIQKKNRRDNEFSLRCPNCKTKEPLISAESGYGCPTCYKNYPI
ncbi:MAG: class I SAM-dependent methyltransferase, partial [Desulfobacterales bacterium]|nr:class I SAM-dependent methyltransferase [Desulfobacterales bacterium]